MSAKITKLSTTQTPLFFGILIAIFIFSLFIFNLKDASASFTISRPSTNNLGLVGHWTFDGADVTDKVYDKSGQGNHGYFYNGATTTAKVPGKIGQALKFDGVDDEIKVSNSNYTFTGLTGSVWIKGNKTIPSSYSMIVSKWNPGFIMAVTSANKLRVYLWDNEEDSTDGVTNINNNQWHHLAFTINTATGKLVLYVDGQQDSTKNTTITNNIIISGLLGINQEREYRGLIDEVRIYNRALSASEVKTLYNQSASKFNKSPVNTLTSGLVGYWTFDGADTNFTTNTVADKSGNNNTGTMTNMSTFTARAPGKIGQALKFDGVNDIVDAGGVNLSNVVTFSAWIKPKNYSENGFNMIALGGTTIGTNNYYLDLFNSTIRWVTYDNSSSFHTRTTAINNNDWKHVVGVIDNNLQSLYVNGVLQGSPLTVTWSYDDMSNSRVSVGNNYWSSAQAFPGLIDDVRIYNRALSASEVKALYNQSASKFNKSPTNTLTSGLVGHWTFDGADTNFTTNTVTDRSGNGNTGTMTNMSTSTARAPGKIGQALKFDGVNDYVDMGDPANGSLDFGTGDFTLSAWIKTANTSLSGALRIINKRNSTSGVGYEIYIENNDNRLEFYVSDSSGFTFGDGGAGAKNIRDSNWHNVAVVFNRSSNAIFYVDGVQNGTPKSISSRSGDVGHAGNLFLGSFVAGPVNFFPGLIDEVRIYNRALSSAEVKTLYNIGR